MYHLTLPTCFTYTNIGSLVIVQRDLCILRNAGVFYFQMLLTEKAEALMEEVDNMIALPDNTSLDRSMAFKVT